MTKLPPEWVRTSDPVIRSPARYRWTMNCSDYEITIKSGQLRSQGSDPVVNDI